MDLVAIGEQAGLLGRENPTADNPDCIVDGLLDYSTETQTARFGRSARAAERENCEIVNIFPESPHHFKGPCFLSNPSRDCGCWVFLARDLWRL